MRFTVHLAGCAANNSEHAKIREATRLALIALSLEKLGHDVRIADALPEVKASRRWDFWKHLYDKGATGGVVIRAAEEFLTAGKRGDVGLKTSVGMRNDRRLLAAFRLLLAHEYDSYVEDFPNLLPVPFMISDRMMDHLIDVGLFRAFIDLDLELIRSFYPRSEDNGLVGFCGYGWAWRKQFLKDAPHWVVRKFYDSHLMTAGEHWQWLYGFRAGLALVGDNQKTYLPPMLAMLGIPIVLQPYDKLETPKMNATTAILCDGTNWCDVLEELNDRDEVDSIVANATDAYLGGWSHLGQAKLICERLGV